MDIHAISTRLTEDEIDLISAVFSPIFYRVALGRSSGLGVSQLLRHFRIIGIHEAVAPSPLFDPLVYAQRSLLAGQPLLETEQPSFMHWLRYGLPLRIVPSAMFDELYYQATNPDVAESGSFGFEHFLRCGMQEGRAPNATFDVLSHTKAIVSGDQFWSRMDLHLRLHGLEPDVDSLPLQGEWGSVLPQASDPAFTQFARYGGHSLTWRWHAGITTEDDASGNTSRSSLQPYYDTIGLRHEQALAWVKRIPSCWPHPENRNALDDAAARVRATDLFDVGFYRHQAGLDHSSGPDAETLDPALHYVLVGEALGFKPCLEFDPVYYARRYPDVLRSGLVLFLHYAEHGRAEGRHGATPSVSHVNPLRFDEGRENVIVVVHESSRTGAPILGWNIIRTLSDTYNIFTVLLGGGALTSEFEALSAEVYGPFLPTQRDVADIEHGLRPLFAEREFRYAIVNSSESRRFVEICARHLVPTVFLLHEFGTYVQPLSELRSAFDWATEIVFPAPTVARSSEQVHPALKARAIRTLPQGMSVVPSGKSPPKPPPLTQLEALSRAKENGTFLVIGAGSVQLRKGVDLFIAAAAAACRASPSRPIHFLWVGHGYAPTKDMGYSIYLHEQIQRSGLERHVTFVSEVSDLEPVYALADAFLLSSRLDPLPNVSIDAACRGIPVICFRDASGTADLMLADPLTAVGVVPHLDADAAGQVIARLASDDSIREAMSSATARLAHRIFDMDHYVAQLDALGRAHVETTARLRADAAVILADDSFDQDLFLGLQPVMESRSLTIARYLAAAQASSTLEPDQDDEERTAAWRQRRPAPGFDARLWRGAHPKRLPTEGDPFADFIRDGRPAGPWQIPVLRPTTHPKTLSLNGTRAVLHVHLPEPMRAHDLLHHLNRNALSCDLLITTGLKATAQEIERILRAYRIGSVHVELAAGDLTDLTAGLASQVAGYDVIGHVTAGEGTTSRIWEDFQWQALLGGRHAMADRILDAFGQAAELGVVFPAEPFVSESRMLDGSLVTGDYPEGGMMWMRGAVLGHLSDLALTDDDADRLLAQYVPIAAKRAGLSLAVAHVPGVMW